MKKGFTLKGKKKLNLLLILVGILVVSVVGTKAATTIGSNMVTYNGTTVKETLDDLVDVTLKGTATSADILEGKTAMVKGNLITGTLKDTSENIATGTITVYDIYNYEVELGFRPVYISILVIYNGEYRSTNIYDSRLDNNIHKIGKDTNQTVGLPLTVEEAIYDTGFRINEGYPYSGWQLHYIALKEFPE